MICWLKMGSSSENKNENNENPTGSNKIRKNIVFYVHTTRKTKLTVAWLHLHGICRACILYTVYPLIFLRLELCF